MLTYPTIAVVQARQWGVPIADLLVLATPGFVMYGIASLPMGVMADRLGGWLVLTIGVFGMAVGTVICGLADSRWQIGLGLGLVGLFASTYHPAGLGLISRGCSRPAWALGVNGAFGSGAVALAPGLAEVLAEGFGWRGAFLGLAVPALITGVAFLIWPIRVPPSPPRTTTGTTPPAEGRSLLSGRFLLLGVGMTLAGLAYRGNSVIFPTLFEERVSFMGPGLATTVTYSLAAVMNLIGGHLAERAGNPKIYLIFHALSLPPLLAMAWLSELPLLLVGALYAGCALGMQPAENGLVAELSPPSRRSLAYGIKFTLTFGVGALAVPLVAAVLDRSGTAAVMVTLSGFVVALVIVAALLNLGSTDRKPGAHSNQKP